MLHHAAEVAWLPNEAAFVWIHDGSTGVVRAADAAALGPTEPKPRGPFSVRGTVTDNEGRPMKDVSVRVARGYGSPFSTQPILTDEQGRYEVHFDIGMGMSGPVKLQCALVSASRPGFYEKDLCREGNLGMAFQRPAESRKGFGAIVYPGHPYNLDFVMLPAAAMRGRLIDAEGKPLARRDIWLHGETPPGQSVLASMQTDADGRFSYSKIPLKPYKLSLREGRTDVSSAPVQFTEAKEYLMEVEYKGPGEALKVRFSTRE